MGSHIIEICRRHVLVDIGLRRVDMSLYGWEKSPTLRHNVELNQQSMVPSSTNVWTGESIFAGF